MTQEEPPITAAVSTASIDNVSRPIDSFLPSGKQILALAKAQERDTNECIRAQGWPGNFQWATSDAELTLFVEGLVRDRRVRSSLWGYFDVPNAPINGYKRGNNTGSIESSSGDAPKDVADRCLDTAVSEHFGVVAFEFAESQVLGQGGPEIPLLDSRFQKIARQWSRCMDAKGFQYEDPLAAMGDGKWREFEVATDLELSVATADVQCKEATNLVGISASIQSAYDDLYISEHRQDLERLSEKMQQYSEP